MYNAKNVIGKVLTARRIITCYSAANESSSVTREVIIGGNVGTVYSFVVDSYGRVWWMLEGFNDFVLHQQGKFNLKALTDQGLITVEEEFNEVSGKDLSWIERNFNWVPAKIKMFVTIGGIIVIGYWGFKYFFIIKKNRK